MLFFTIKYRVTLNQFDKEYKNKEQEHDNTIQWIPSMDNVNWWMLRSSRVRLTTISCGLTSSSNLLAGTYFILLSEQHSVHIFHPTRSGVHKQYADIEKGLIRYHQIVLLVCLVLSATSTQVGYFVIGCMPEEGHSAATKQWTNCCHTLSRTISLKHTSGMLQPRYKLVDLLA